MNCINFIVPVSSVTITAGDNNAFVIDEKQSKDIECVVSRALPAATILWYKEPTNFIDNIRVLETTQNITMNPDGTYRTTNQLTYLAKREDNAMRIFCVANSSDGLVKSASTPSLDIKCEFGKKVHSIN